MNEITLEKIDIVRERTGATYAEAKEALEASNANVVDAIIYIEKSKKTPLDSIYTTKDEFLAWIKELINRGNVTRIKVKKDEKTIVDLPVNAGIAVGIVAAAVWAPLIAIGVIGAVVTNITIEITKKDGSVEVVNKVIKATVQDVKEKVNDVASDVKEKVTDVASDVKDKFTSKKTEEAPKENETVYTYTVKFDDTDNNEQK
ncbi:UBA/TS-N domain protein [Clostridiales bacterium oral taxon 876 str. F0540]|nr:UBA/TS-N domain protein [Clostridiales bacterium oral taxon 876 str. F0540]